MAGAQRIFKQKIKATSTLEKVFRAMELIAASRITKARDKAIEADPYTRALTEAISAVAAHSDQNNQPLLKKRTDTNRVAILVVTSDRGMAGAYSSSVLRETDKLIEELREQGKEPVLYVSGRRGESYYSFRGIPVEKTWTGNSDNPQDETADLIGDELVRAFSAPADEGGVSEVILVYTRFVSMVRQVVQTRHMLPIEIVEADEPDLGQGKAINDDSHELADILPLYDFEPDAETVFARLLPLYVRQRIRTILLMAAASELASRQQAMHAATDNAKNLIEEYTRKANNARQAEITTEITEIVSGADALSN
ncbi:MAG: F0F1 ATP synthase subunit gamma [Actinomycetaceae bacterium]|nr:F0F1 ATP synthase subunit gamma [Actinomycetaceae bacterium]